MELITIYYRGGLAEEASVLMSNSQTGLSLWYSQLERNFTNGRVPAPALRLCIDEVLPLPEATIFQSRVSLVRCHAISGDAPRGDMMVFLECNQSPHARARFTDKMDVQEGGQLRVWQPWHTVGVATSMFSMKASSESANPNPASSEETIQLLFCPRFWVLPP